MQGLLYLTLGVVVSMAVIPVMIRLAPRLGMIDQPEARKVHRHPVPRVGGWGILLGALVPLLVLLPLDLTLGLYVLGSGILLLFGALDDREDIGHYPKFAAQILAVAPLVVLAGVRVERLPLVEGTLPPEVSVPFTIFAMVGAINAINHSDGLDGLAGGVSLLSLSGLALLGYGVDVPLVTWIALAAIGGVLGFLRYNTHPAQVFMGDAGSQFLGFTLAFLTVYLIQHAPPLSAALPALLLGLPIIDILAVLAQRIHHGLNWFKATRNHIHHRLLDLGFDHYECVILIYGAQTFLVVAAVLMRFEADAGILALYLGVCAGVYLALVLLEGRGWRVRQDPRPSAAAGMVQRLTHSAAVRDWPIGFVAFAIPVYVLGSCARIDTVPLDYGLYALGLFVLLLVEILRGRMNALVGRIAIYAAAVFVVFLTSNAAGAEPAPLAFLDVVYFAALALAVALGIRFSQRVRFGTTPLDYLVIFVVALIAIFPMSGTRNELISILLIKGFVILYGCELLLTRAAGRWSPLSIAALGALGIIGVRGVAPF